MKRKGKRKVWIAIGVVVGLIVVLAGGRWKTRWSRRRQDNEGDTEQILILINDRQRKRCYSEVGKSLTFDFYISRYMQGYAACW